MPGSLLNWFRTRLSGLAPLVLEEEMTVKIVAAPPLRSCISSQASPLATNTSSSAPTLRSRISMPTSPIATKIDNAAPLRTRIIK